MTTTLPVPRSPDRTWDNTPSLLSKGRLLCEWLWAVPALQSRKSDCGDKRYVYPQVMYSLAGIAASLHHLGQHIQNSLEQWSSSFLMLQTLYHSSSCCGDPPTKKSSPMLLHNCNRATLMNRNVCIWYTGHLICNSQRGCNHRLRTADLEASSYNWIWSLNLWKLTLTLPEGSLQGAKAEKQYDYITHWQNLRNLKTTRLARYPKRHLYTVHNNQQLSNWA